MTADNKDEVTLAPSYGCQPMVVPIYGCISSQPLDLSQVIFFKSDNAFAQTSQPEKMPTNSTDDGKVTWNWYTNKS